MSDDGKDKPDPESTVIRIRGLPWSATKAEIKEFFEGQTLRYDDDPDKAIHLTLNREGRASGEAYVEFETDEDIENALKKDRQHLGKRYVEVFKGKFNEMEWVIQRAGKPLLGDYENDSGENCVRLRGLPFECNRDDIVKFFDGCEIGTNGILMTSDYMGRSSGEAFIQFVDNESYTRGLGKNKESIGHRYIEVFPSSMAEARRHQMQMGGGRQMGQGYGYGRGGGGGGGGRPSPYDRRGNGGGGYGGGRGGRGNFKRF